ncbi:MAG: VOC family protein [Planctomycetaceae bacterium]
MRFSEVAIFTDDVDAAADFYERLLGAAAVHRGDGIAVFDVGGVQVLVHEKCEPSSDAPPCEDHIAFAVPDVDRTVRELEERGLTVEFPAREYDWGRFLYVRDPQGHLLEIQQA